MDDTRDETGLLSPVSSPKANSTSHEDEVHPTEVVGDDYLPVESSESAHQNAAPSRC